MITYRIRISLLFIPIAFALTLSSQISLGQQIQKKVEKNRTCRILFLSAAGTVTKKLHLYDGVESQEVELPRMNLSKVYKIASGPVTLHMLTSAVEEGMTIPRESPFVKVPEGVEHIYLLVISDRSNKVTPVKMSIVNANYDQLGRGEMLWFNLTKNTIAGRIGSQKLQIKAGGRTVIKEPAKGREGYPVELYFRIPGDTFTHPLCETRWRHDPRSRSLAFILNDGNRRTPRIYNYSDFRKPSEDKKSEPK